MLTPFLLVQLAVNVALVCSVILLVRERMSASRLAAEREARLEALARELCALGRELTRAEDRRESLRPRDARRTPGPDDSNRPPVARMDATPAARIQGATALLDQGEAVACVAARTALSEGEVQILRNLRRRPVSPAILGEPGGAERQPGGRLGTGVVATRKRRPRSASAVAAGSC
jgi:hypothetical protein